MAIVPSHGDSTRRSLTRLRPGSLIPGGQGVDVKHNSYARYLARLKAPLLRTQILGKPAKKGNKTRNYGLFPGCECPPQMIKQDLLSKN